MSRPAARWLHRPSAVLLVAILTLPTSLAVLPPTPAAAAALTLTALPGTLYDAQIPSNIQLDASGLLQTNNGGGQAAFDLTNGQFVAPTVRVDVPASGSISLRMQVPLAGPCNTNGHALDLTAKVTQDVQSSALVGTTSQTIVIPVLCPSYRVSVQVPPTATLLSDVQYAPGRPPVLVCIQDAAGNAIPPATPTAPPSLNVTETTTVTSRETGPSTPVTAHPALTANRGDSCYTVTHSGTTSDQAGHVTFSAQLDLNLNGIVDPRSRDVASPATSITLLRSRLVTATPFCGSGTESLIITGALWNADEQVKLTLDGAALTTAPIDATVARDGTFSVTVPNFAPTPGRHVISGLVRQVSLGVITGASAYEPVHAQQVGILNPCDGSPLLQVNPTLVQRPATADPLVGVTVAGFPPNQPVRFSGSPSGLSALLDANGIDLGGLDQAVADNAGRFRGAVRIIGANCGAETLTATGIGTSATAPVTVLCPTLTLTPASIPEYDEPSSTLATGAGFQPRASVNVTLGRAAASVHVDDAGGFSVSLPVDLLSCNGNINSPPPSSPPLPPPTSGAAEYAVNADQTTPAEHASAPIFITCPGIPTVAVAPPLSAFTDGARPYAVTLTNFRPGQVVDLTVDGQGVGSAGPLANATRTLEVKLTGVSCGKHTLGASDSIDGPSTIESASTTFLVTCPTLVVSPGPYDVDNLPAATPVAGRGYDPSTTIHLTVPGAAPVDVVTGADGSFVTSVRIIDPPCNATKAIGTELVTLPLPPVAQAPLSIICPSPPTLTLDPPSVAASSGTRLIQVKGSGWRPGSTLPLLAVGADSLDVNVDAAGAFVGTLTFHALEAGTSPVTASQPYRKANTTLGVTTPLLTASPVVISTDDLPIVVTLRGQGFDPGVGVTVSALGLPPRVLVVGTDGTFALDLPPKGAACGQGVARAEEGYGPNGAAVPAPSAQAPMVVNCPTPPKLSVSPSPAAYTPGARPYTVNGVSFRPGAVHLSIDGVAAGTGAADSTGRLSITLHPAGLGCGAHTVTGDPAVGTQASAAFLVTCPVLHPSPGRLNNRHLPATVSVFGAGFDPGVNVLLAVPGSGSVITKVNAVGAFHTRFPTASFTCAAVAMTGVEQMTLPVPPRAATSIVLDCPQYTPTLIASRNVMPEGDVAQLVGTGYHPKTVVNILWMMLDGTPALGKTLVTTDKAGSFTTSMLILNHDRLGPREAVGSDAAGAVAKATLLIVPSSVQPGRHQTILTTRHGLLSRR